MPKRHIFLLVLGIATAAAVLVLLFQKRPAPQPTLAGLKPATETDLSPVEGRLPLAVTRLHGKVAVYPASMSGYWLADEESVVGRESLGLPTAPHAHLAAGDVDVFLRRGARLRAWQENGVPVVTLEDGEIHVDAGPLGCEVRCGFSVLVRGAACLVRLSGQGVHLAITRGTVAWRHGPRQMEFVEGEQVDAVGSKLSGSMTDDLGTVMAWVEEARKTHNLFRPGPIAVKPGARYRLRGRAGGPGLVVRGGGRTVVSLVASGGESAGFFTTPDGVTEITVEGAQDGASLCEVAAP